MLTFGSLFAGIGGIDLGLERAGMRCVWQVELDDYARRVLAKHWPDVLRLRDVRDCGAANLPAVDLVAGGFPCQDISYAGRGAGLGGERSGLWWEFARIVRGLRPQYVLVENVSALLVRGLDAVLGSLAALGYDAEWHCIPAAAVGAPHRRDRAFIVAYANGWGAHLKPQCIPERASASYVDGDGALRPLAHTARQRLALGVRVTRDAYAQLAAFERGCCGPGGQWSTEPNVGRVAHGVSARVDRLRGLGNAVVPQVAEFVGRLIVDYERRINIQ